MFDLTELQTYDVGLAELKGERADAPANAPSDLSSIASMNAAAASGGPSAPSKCPMAHLHRPDA